MPLFGTIGKVNILHFSRFFSWCWDTSEKRSRKTEWEICIRPLSWSFLLKNPQNYGSNNFNNHNELVIFHGSNFCVTKIKKNTTSESKISKRTMKHRTSKHLVSFIQLSFALHGLARYLIYEIKSRDPPNWWA